MSESRQQELYQSLGVGLGRDGRILTKIAPDLAKILGKYESDAGKSVNENELFLTKLKDFFLLLSKPANPLILCFDNACNWDKESMGFFKGANKRYKR